MATQNFINECKNMANANRLGRFELQMYDRFEKEFKGDTKQNTSILPDGYTQVDYIRADGSSYIDTDYIPNSNTRFYIKASTEGVSGHTGLFGSRTANSGYPFLSYIENSYGGVANSIRIDITGRTGNTGKTWETNVPFEIDIDVPNKKVLVNDEQLTAYNNISYNTSSEVTFSLFAVHTGTNYAYPIVGKIFNCKIYENNILVRNFVPCYRNSDNEVGLYDLVNNTFYENNGSGTLTYGSIVSIPNPDYPQEMQSVTGLQNINVTGKNLIDLVPIDNIDFNYSQQCTTEYITDNEIGKKVLHISSNSSYPTVRYNLNKRLNKNKYYCLQFKYKYIVDDLGGIIQENAWIAPSWGGNPWDNLSIFNSSYLKSNDNTSMTKPSNTYRDKIIKIKINDAQYENNADSYKYMLLSLGYGKVNNNYVNKDFYISDLMIYEISEADYYNNDYVVIDYEQYKKQSYEVNLGKNLFNSFIATKPSWQSGNLEINEDGSFTVSENSSSNNYFQVGQKLKDFCPSLKVGDTVYLYLETTNSNKRIYIGQNWVNGESKTLTETMLNSNFVIYGGYGQTDTIKIMITKELDTNYSPYFTPIELNKIGDYQDRIYKDNGTWYIEKKIGKYTNTNTNDFYTVGYTYTNTEYVGFQKPEDMLNKGTYGAVEILCDKLVNINSISSYDSTDMIGKITARANLNALWAGFAKGTGLTTERQQLSGLIMYYQLSTPTYIEITNEELINQLEAIELLKGENNITITSEDLPIIFDYSFWNGDTEVDEDDRFLEVNQSNYLTSIELKDSCCVNNNILGTTYTKSAEVELLDLPVGTKLVSKAITPEVGVKYANESTEYETFDNYTIESVTDEQTASNTKFTAMNGGALLDKEYICSLSFENGQTHTINEFYQDACNQIGITPTDTTFDNSEIVMTGNPFTNKETIRTVISEVEKTSCSIARIDWKNKTISLMWLSDQINYEFNTSDYSTLEGSLTQYGPLNVIIIANSQLDGENVVMTDEESVAEYGEHQIIIDSPYFLYTEELRTQAIQAIYNKLDGLKYYDLKLTTPYGKPFLNIGDKIRINTNENQVLDTYVLSHTFKFDGTFSSIIESPALTQEEQTIKNEFKGNSVREKLRRTELMVDKTTGDITAITDRVTTVENEFGDVYSKEEVNTLVQNSATGVTNTFVNSGGNNLLRNTGLWFEDRSEIEYMYPRTTGLYPSDELFMSADPHWEYWKGNAKKVKEDKAANMSGILLQTGYFEQTQQVRNGTYTLSFKYRKLIGLATVNVQINDRYIDLTNIEDTEIIEVGEITAQNISIKIFSDTDDSCIIYDLMLNAGSEKAEYSQHQNETTTDTVNISKGITIQSSDTNTTFKANSDGIRVYNSRDMDTPITEYTDTGMDTNRIKVKAEAEILQVLWKNVGNNTWISRL